MVIQQPNRHMSSKIISANVKKIQDNFHLTALLQLYEKVKVKLVSHTWILRLISLLEISFFFKISCLLYGGNALQVTQRALLKMFQI